MAFLRTTKLVKVCIHWYYLFTEVLSFLCGLINFQSKVSIYANLCHVVQMFSQISHNPDFKGNFWVKRSGLSAGVYGTQSSSCHMAAITYTIQAALISLWLRSKKRRRHLFTLVCMFLSIMYTPLKVSKEMWITKDVNLYPRHKLFT